MKETSKAKGKAAVKQDLENTLSFYNEALTKKVIGQLFDEYVKDDEDSYYTKTSRNSEYYDEFNYDSENSHNPEDSKNSGGFYFGDTFSSFSKENLLANDDDKINYDYNINNSYDNNYSDFPSEYDEENEFSELSSEIRDKNTHTHESIAPPLKKKTLENKNEYYEYDDFDDDFDQYDYEPKKKKKRKPIKIKPKRHMELGETEDFLDKKRKEQEALESGDIEVFPAKNLDKHHKKANLSISGKKSEKKEPEEEMEYNIFIKDLTASKKEKDEPLTRNLPPLKDKNIPQRDIGYEDVLRYSPRRRGGRNQTVKKKKRVPLSENKNIYPDGAGVSSHTPKRKNQGQKSKIIIHGPKTKRRKSKLPLLTSLFIFTLIVSLIFCLIKIKSLTEQIDVLNELLKPSQTQQPVPENNDNSDPNENPI